MIIIIMIALNSCQQKTPKTKEQSSTLVWVEDFNVDGAPNPEYWSYDIGNGCPTLCGWGNNELQYYTDKDLKNARVQDGILIIEAHQTKEPDRQFTSARLVTKNKADWKYGKIEIKAKLPTGIGTWPAIWMLPTENMYGTWPASGEIDIMEHVGYEPDSIYGTVHTSTYNHMLGTQVGGQLLLENAESTFNTYAIEWTKDKISWYINDIPYHHFTNDHKSSAEWPFDQTFHLILNIAVGGNWGGKKGIDTSIWPQKMEVDWIKVWK